MNRTAFSASNLARRIACPGSLSMETGLPDVTSEDSDVGTLLHDLLAHPEKPRGDLSADQLEVITSAEAMEEELASSLNPTADRHGWVEPEVGFIHNSKLLFVSHLDKLYLWRGSNTGLVVDYKTLYGSHKQASENWQILCYCVQAMDRFNLDTCYGAILQPRVSRQVKPVKVTSAEAATIHNRIFKAWTDCAATAAERVPSWPACQFCKGLAFGVCKEAREAAFLPLTEFSKETAIERSPEQVLSSLEPSKRTQLFDSFKLAAKLQKTYTEAAKVLAAKDPEFVPDYKLFPGGERETIADMVNLYGRLKELGCSPRDFSEHSSMSKAKLESLLRAITGKKGGELKQLIDETVAGLTDKTPIADSFERV